MFVRSVTIKGKKYYRIVENYRVNGKVKQAYVCSLGVYWQENAKEYLADDAEYRDALEKVKDDPQVRRLVRRLSPGRTYDGRRRGVNDNPFAGRAKELQCPETGLDVVHRVEKESGRMVCLDGGSHRECKKCEWKC